MVECELQWRKDIYITVLCFNRYMVECELFHLHETLYILHSFNRYMVECESYQIGNALCRGISFNRYMVECELGKRTQLDNVHLVLIDTWWNVNILISAQQMQLLTF